MNNSLYAVTALRERLDIFLGKLKQRGEEVAAEARAAAPDMNQLDPDEYKRSYAAFKVGIQQQMRQLITKAEKVFEQQFSVFEDVDDPEVTNAYNAAEDAVEDFVSYIDDLSDNLFNAVDDQDAEAAFQKAVDDWKEAAAAFTCQQCSAPVPVPQLYYQAQYLPCLGCGTQTTFVPSSNMQLAPRLAEDVAMLRTRSLEEEIDRVAASPDGWVGQVAVMYINYELAKHRQLVELLPAYAETQVEFILQSLRAEIFTKGHTFLEPVGTREADVTYYNIMGSLGDSMAVLRRDNDTLFVGILSDIVRVLARPGCEVAAAILDGSYNNQLWERYAALAERSPVA